MTTFHGRFTLLGPVIFLRFGDRSHVDGLLMFYMCSLQMASGSRYPELAQGGDGACSCEESGIRRVARLRAHRRLSSGRLQVPEISVDAGLKRQQFRR
jgi:hypothetical protein